MHEPPQLILASASPRRAELLRNLGLRFSVQPQHLDESQLDGEAVKDFVCRLAGEKAFAVQAAAVPVLGADTVVVARERVLGKPRDQADAVDMLLSLAGRKHQVMTAVAVAQGSRIESALSISEVTFRTVTRSEAQAYWDSGEPRDKAGGYAIQGLGGIFVQRLEGSYSGVVGLPVLETSILLRRFGITVLSD